MGAPTLSRFYAFHFILPLGLVVVVISHIVLLHSAGSSNPLGISLDSDKAPFTPYFRIKDIVGVAFLLRVYSFVLFFHPWRLGDPDNFILANPLVTPEHIIPE